MVTKKANQCEWQYDEFHDAYHTSCGEIFIFIDGTPAENQINYCPYCGKQLHTYEAETDNAKGGVPMD